MRVAGIMLAVQVFATQVAAQTVSDAAVAECQADGQSFSAVRNCLPDVEVSLQMLTAVAAPEFFGEAGAVIVAACAERNERSPAIWACTKNAIRDAVELVQMVGSPDMIQDQRFRGVSDAATFERLEQRERTIRQLFRQDFWGGTLYTPLR